MHKITKQFAFSASHCLPHLPEGHKCRNLHGHNYRVIVGLVSEKLDEKGMVYDYGELSFVKQFIDSELDHAHLATNEVEAKALQKGMAEIGVLDSKVFVVGATTTAEHLAFVLYNYIVKELPNGVFLNFVEVQETENTSARFME